MRGVDCAVQYRERVPFTGHYLREHDLLSVGLTGAAWFIPCRPILEMNDIGVIHLGNGGFTLVDSDLLPELSKSNWGRDSDGYVFRSVGGAGKQKKIKLHRVVNSTPDGVFTDHINGCRHDNRRSNLRNANFVTNGANRRVNSSAKSSRFKGVSWNKKQQKWRASIKFNKVGYHLGSFDSENEAATAYNRAAIEKFGEFAWLNKIEL